MSGDFLQEIGRFEEEPSDLLPWKRGMELTELFAHHTECDGSFAGALRCRALKANPGGSNQIQAGWMEAEGAGWRGGLNFRRKLATLE